MARDIGSIVKMSRREGYALHPKAHKALAKRAAVMPGKKILGVVVVIKQVSTLCSYVKSKKLSDYMDCSKSNLVTL